MNPRPKPQSKMSYFFFLFIPFHLILIVFSIFLLKKSDLKTEQEGECSDTFFFFFAIVFE